MYKKEKAWFMEMFPALFFFSLQRVLMVLLVFLFSFFLHFEGPKKRLQELVPRGHAGTFTWMWRHFCFILARWWHLAGGGPFYANDEQEGVGEVPLAALPFMDPHGLDAS